MNIEQVLVRGQMDMAEYQQRNSADERNMQSDLLYIDKHCILLCLVVFISATVQVYFVRRLFSSRFSSKSERA